MVFSSTIFLFIFLPVCLFFYFIVDKKFKNLVLLIFSLIFYAWGEPKSVILMLFSILFNYFFGILVEKDNKYIKKSSLILACVYNLGVLFVFKYLNFSIDTFNELFNQNIEIAKIALPIGISFYTFQNLSYVIDVYRGNVKAQRKFLDLALYVSLFPQLIAGPIVRYINIQKQIINRVSSIKRVREGLVRFQVGFIKKVLIADVLSGLVDIAFRGEYPSIYTNWIGAIAYALQIYFDFSGYSDMAIGIGRILGFKFLENFNYPYISRSIQEFWRRWHISLSSWFKDYVYIPLGGSREGNFKTYRNIFIVFLLCGTWHGASFNFIFWGVYYALFLMFERAIGKSLLEKLPLIFRHFYAILVVLVGWVFFRADTMIDAVKYLKGMVTFQGKDLANFNFIMNGEYYLFLIVGILCSMPHTKIKNFFKKTIFRICISDFLTLLIFLVAISYMVGKGHSPFLYFRF